jgi:hypothetical protein
MSEKSPLKFSSHNLSRRLQNRGSCALDFPPYFAPALRLLTPLNLTVASVPQTCWVSRVRDHVSTVH